MTQVRKPYKVKATIIYDEFCQFNVVGPFTDEVVPGTQNYLYDSSALKVVDMLNEAWMAGYLEGEISNG